MSFSPRLLLIALALPACFACHKSVQTKTVQPAYVPGPNSVTLSIDGSPVAVKPSDISATNTGTATNPVFTLWAGSDSVNVYIVLNGAHKGTLTYDLQPRGSYIQISQLYAPGGPFYGSASISFASDSYNNIDFSRGTISGLFTDRDHQVHRIEESFSLGYIYTSD